MSNADQKRRRVRGLAKIVSILPRAAEMYRWRILEKPRRGA
jgi:hypothetical protein